MSKPIRDRRVMNVTFTSRETNEQNSHLFQAVLVTCFEDGSANMEGASGICWPEKDAQSHTIT
jgi:hypothetical protein